MVVSRAREKKAEGSGLELDRGIGYRIRPARSAIVDLRGVHRHSTSRLIDWSPGTHRLQVAPKDWSPPSRSTPAGVSLPASGRSWDRHLPSFRADDGHALCYLCQHGECAHD